MFNYYLAKGKKGIVSYHTQIDSNDTTTYNLKCSKELKILPFLIYQISHVFMCQNLVNMKLKNL